MNYMMEALALNKWDSSWSQKAKQKWDSLLNEKTALDEDVIAGLATVNQDWFEKNCGGRYLGQEIMVLIGLGQYYSTETGFDNEEGKALAMYRGLRKSDCSMEIHSEVADLAKILGLRCDE